MLSHQMFLDTKSCRMGPSLFILGLFILVLVFSSFLTCSSPLLPALTRFYPLLPTLTRSYPLLSALTRSYPLLPALTRSYPLLPAPTRSYPLLPAFTRFSPLLTFLTLYPQTNIFRMDQHFIVDFFDGDCYVTMFKFSADIPALTRSFPLLLSLTRFTHF